MNIKKLGSILIPLLVLYLIYDKLLAKKEFLPKLEHLEQDLSYSEETLLQRQFNSKKFTALKKSLAVSINDFRLYEKNPSSHVQSQIRQASNSKLKVFSFNAGGRALKELYKDSESASSLYYLDTTVNAQNLTVRDLAELMIKLRKQKPRLVWTNLSINSNNPDKISLNGKLRAFFLSEDLTAVLKGAQL